MKYVYVELMNLLNNKKILISMIALFFLNYMCLLIYIDSDRIDPQKYKEIKNKIICGHETAEDLYFQDSESIENQNIYLEYCTVNSYRSYYDKVMNESDENRKISLFQTKFLIRNIEKTQKDYQKLKDIPVRFTGSYGLCKILKYPGSRFLIFIFMFVVVMESVIRDKKNSLINLYKTTANGDGRLIISKYIAVSILLAVAEAVINISNILAAYINYGRIDLYAPVQCLMDFVEVGLSLNIGQFLCINYLCSMMFLYAFVALLFLISVISGSEAMVFIKTSLIALFAYAVSGFLRKNNLFLFYDIFSGKILDTKFLFSYRNQNIMEYPVNAIISDIVICIFFIVFCLSISCFYYMNNEMYYKNGFIEGHGCKRYKGKVKSLNLFTLETYKLLFGYKIIFVFLFLLFIQFYLYFYREIHWSMTDLAYKFYMSRIEGDITEEKIHYLEQEDQMYRELEKQLEELEAQIMQGEITEAEYNKNYDELTKKLEYEKGFYKCREYTDYVIAKDRSHENRDKKIKMGFVYDRGYNLLIGNNSKKNEILNNIIFWAVFLVVIPYLYTEDYKDKFNELIDTTRNRNQLKKIKFTLAAILLGVTYILIFVPEIIWIYKKIGLNGLYYDVRSLYDLRHIPITVSILEYISIINLIRIFGISFLSYCMVKTGRKMKSSFGTVVLTVILIIIPLLLAYFGK